MSKVFFDAGLSLDGFIAGDNHGPKNTIGDGGMDHSPFELYRVEKIIAAYLYWAKHSPN